MAINQLSQSNTFQHWLIATQQLIAFANTITDGGEGTEFIVNTNMTVNGTVNTRNVITQTLRVTGQSSLNIVIANSIFTNTINANFVTSNIVRTNVITFGDGTTLNSNSFISTLTSQILSVNNHVNGAVSLKIEAAYNHANNSYNHANGAYDKANTGFNSVSAAYNHANNAFDKANTVLVYSTSGYTHANLAYNRANTAWTLANDAYALASGITGIEGSYVTLGTGQTITGQKSFTQLILGSINGNAGTVTNGVYTQGVGDQYILGRKIFRQMREYVGSIDAGQVVLNSGVYDMNVDAASVFFLGSVAGTFRFVGGVNDGIMTSCICVLYSNAARTFQNVVWAGGSPPSLVLNKNNIFGFFNTGLTGGIAYWYGINMGVGF